MSVFSWSILCSSSWLHELQHARLPCPSLSPRVSSNSCLLSWWCHPTISSSVTPFSPALNLPQHECLLQWVGSLHQVAKQSELFSFSISLSNESLGLISFGIDWFDLPSSQETLKSLLQHYSLKASFLQCSDFFMAQLSHLYMNTGKNIDLTIWTFVSKVMSLLFNMLSKLVITVLPRSKHLLISWLQSLHWPLLGK